LSEMIRALVAALGAEHVRLNSPVEEITGRGPFIVRTSAGDAIDAPAVIVAAPAYASTALLRERDAELARLAGEVVYASAVTVAMAFARDAVRHPLTGSGFVV